MDHKGLLKSIDKAGLQLRTIGSGHYGVYREGRLLTVVSTSPRGGRRSVLNAVAQLRQAGVDLATRHHPRKRRLASHDAPMDLGHPRPH